MALVKSGWLWRQSSVLRRWKKHWFDLWMDGGLVYYPDDTRQNIEERIPLRFNSLNVRCGRECGEVQPPEGSDQESIVTVDLRDRTRLLLCAESEDDAVAWKMALEDMRSHPVYIYNPYDDYYQTVPMNSHHAVYVNPGYGGPGYGGPGYGGPGYGGPGYDGYGPGMTHLVIRDERDALGEQMALGLLAGALTSSALSSLMWLPCWF